MARVLVLSFLAFAVIGLLPAAASADEVAVKRFPAVSEDQSRPVEIPKMPLVNRRDLEPANTPAGKAVCITFSEQVLNHYCNTTWGSCYQLRSWCCAYCYDDPFVCVTIGC